MKPTPNNREAGIALLLTLLAALLILAAVALITTRVVGEKRVTDEAVVETQLDEACKAGIDLAIQRVWNQYVTGNGNTTGNMASYTMFIDNLVANNEDLDYSGTMDGQEFDSNGDGVFDSNPPSVLIDADTPRVLPSGERIVSLTVERTDDVTGIDLTLRATGEVNRRTRTAIQTLRVAGQLFQGFDYAVLANNINCILCHAKVYSLNLSRNADAALYGSFDRVKMACLESMMIRTSENVATRVAGSVYSRGTVYNQSGTQMTAAQIAASTLQAFGIDNSNGKITQDSAGSMTSPQALANAQKDAKGNLLQFANLYMQYPTDPAKMTDGNLPSKFPAPFPDDNGNRTVDDAEFQKIVNSANGSLRFQLDPSLIGGSITGGVAYGVPRGSSFVGTALPTASTQDALTQLDDGKYDGNLILIGTEADPIVINSRVAVNGDVVIKGPVKGWGQLLVRGNAYVAGDVTYADAAGQFGQAADGTKNGFALTAGGSVMVGDYLTIRGKNHSYDSAKYPDFKGAIDMRATNRNVTMSVSGKPNEVKGVGYFDTGVVDPGAATGNQSQYSFTTSEIMLFNRMEKAKAQADATYQARYYRLRPSAPVYTYTANDEHAVKYSDPGVAVIAAPGSAAIQDLSPKDFWLTEDQLRYFWYADEMTRPASGRPFKFDGLMYSNNSIFFISRSNSRTVNSSGAFLTGHKSNAYGRMQIRGAVVSADLGVLVPGDEHFGAPRSALDLFYDPRVAAFLRVEDTTQVTFNRVTYRYE